MEKIKYKGQVYVRVDEEFTAQEKSQITQGMPQVKSALAALQKGHRALASCGSLSEAAYEDLDDAKRACDKVIKRVTQALKG